MTPRFGHLVVGPSEHGVVRHALAIAETSAGRATVVVAAGPMTVDDAAVASLAACDAVLVAFTDRLFGPTCEAAAEAFVALAQRLRSGGAVVVVGLHDLPDRSFGALQVRRAAAYRAVVEAAAAVVVGSHHEAGLTRALGAGIRPLSVIPLPVATLPRATGAPPPVAELVAGQATVLGFVYPGKGHDDVLAALDGLPPDLGVVALGRPSDGHDALVAELEAAAKRLGRRFTVTGFVEDRDLPAALVAAGVPVAPHTRVSASASIAAWLGAGRRPLVPDVPYVRELERRAPGLLRIYRGIDDLRAQIAAALGDPSRTWLDPGASIGPTLREVTRAHDEALLGAARFVAGRPIALPDGRFVVPGNRWDLVQGRPPTEPPLVTVVVPYFEAQAELDLVLAALAQQTHPRERLEIVIADDGSAVAPTVPPQAEGLTVRVVRQEDRGFRVSAARNLGAAAARGSILLFLDGDTVPTPGYVEAMVRLPSVLPDALVVGARAHFALEGWEPGPLTAWLRDPERAPGPAELPAPKWLAELYGRTGDLLLVDDRGYEGVIGAVMAIDRALFDEIGGFDTSYEAYGGEDWEFAYRASAAGAVLAHAPDGVAVHAGDEWAVRSAADPVAAAEQKRAEEARLADSIPGRAPRRQRSAGAAPEFVVTLDPAMGEAAALATARTIAADAEVDAVVWLGGPTVGESEDESAGSGACADGDAEPSSTDRGSGASTDRIRRGTPSANDLARCRVQVLVAQPHRFAPGTLRSLGAAVRADGPAGGLLIASGVKVVASRSARRAERWAPPLGRPEAAVLASLFGLRTAGTWPGVDATSG